MTTIRSFSNNGPYFAPTQGVYQAASLKDILFRVRLCMEDEDFMIGLFDDNGQCKGIWEDSTEGIPDGEGGMMREAPCYVLYRPGSISKGMWNMHLRHFARG